MVLKKESFVASLLKRKKQHSNNDQPNPPTADMAAASETVPVATSIRSFSELMSMQDNSKTATRKSFIRASDGDCFKKRKLEGAKPSPSSEIRSVGDLEEELLRKLDSHRTRTLRKGSNPEILAPLKWTEEELAASPFERDFSSLIQYNSVEAAVVEEYKTTHNLLCLGMDARPILEFNELKCESAIMRPILKRYERPTSIQAQAWPVILKGRDFIGLAQTGSGKTLAYILPALVHLRAQPPPKPLEGPIVLVLSPARELAVQILAEFQEFQKSMKIAIAPVFGGQTFEKGPIRRKQVAPWAAPLHVAIATPGKLIDLLEAQVANLRRVTFLVLDEADRLLTLGFSDQIICLVRQTRPDRQTVLFSATMISHVKSLAKRFLSHPVKVVAQQAGRTTCNPDVQQFVVKVANDKERQRSLFSIIDSIREGKGPNDDVRVLIFVNNRETVDVVAELLQRMYVDVYSIFAEMSQPLRMEAMKTFCTNKRAMLVATDVASRGWNIEGLPAVINYELPKYIDQYVHRIGRTGRAGHKGLAYSLYNPENKLDQFIHRPLFRFIEASGQTPPDFLPSKPSKLEKKFLKEKAVKKVIKARIIKKKERKAEKKKETEEWRKKQAELKAQLENTENTEVAAAPTGTTEVDITTME